MRTLLLLCSRSKLAAAGCFRDDEAPTDTSRLAISQWKWKETHFPDAISPTVWGRAGLWYRGASILPRAQGKTGTLAVTAASIGRTIARQAAVTAREIGRAYV